MRTVEFVGEQGIQPLRVLHLGGDEVHSDALKKSPVCRPLLREYPRTDLRLRFLQRAVDIAARLGIKTVQVSADSAS